MNLIGLAILVWYDDRDFNVFVFTVLGANVVVFGIRAWYACGRGDALFSEKNFRAAEQATNAERVAVCVYRDLRSSAVSRKLTSMKRIAPLTLAAALVLAGCTSNTESEPASEPTETETTADAEVEYRPAGVPVIEDQLDVDQWTERIQDETIRETNEDGIPVHAADNEYDVLLTDGVIEPGYSYIAAIEDARYTCYILTAAIGNTGELSSDILEGITAAQHLAQTSRVENNDYPDVQEYENDEKPNVHTKAAVIHLCPDTVEYFDDELANTPPFSEAIAEMES